MALQIIPVVREHAEDLSLVLFQAFRDVHERHHFPLDIPSPQLASRMINFFVGRSDMYGVAAVLDGKVVGSNFVGVSDEVGGIGPISVDPACQARGVGRALMRHVLDWSLKHHGPMVRLMQDAFNMISLSLYSSLGFTVVEPVVLMEVKPAKAGDPSVRPLTHDDLAACDVLCRRVCKVSRKNELASFIEGGHHSGFVPHGRFDGGRLRAYVVPGFLGHAVAESSEDFLVAIAQAARNVPAHAHKVFVPMRNGKLFRVALGLGFRAIKPMSLMALGPYEPPLGPETGAAWSPSIAY